MIMNALPYMYNICTARSASAIRITADIEIKFYIFTIYSAAPPGKPSARKKCSTSSSACRFRRRAWIWKTRPKTQPQLTGSAQCELATIRISMNTNCKNAVTGARFIFEWQWQSQGSADLPTIHPIGLETWKKGITLKERIESSTYQHTIFIHFTFTFVAFS